MTGGPATGDAVTRFADERAILRLLVRYNRLVDDGRATEVVDLFSVDGHLRAMGRDLHGRDELVAFFGASGPPPAHHSTSHLLSNTLIELEGDEARCVSDFAVVARQPEGPIVVLMAGRYVDTLRRSPEAADGWLLTERLVVGHARPGPPPSTQH